MLGEPSHLGSDLVLRIGEELERRHLSSLQVREALSYSPPPAYRSRPLSALPSSNLLALQSSC
jgi:hypothetical protein